MTDATETEQDIRAIKALTDAIRPLLVAQKPFIISAALADLMAMLIAGYVVPNNAAATDRLRAGEVRRHAKLISDLIKPNAAQLRERIAEGEKLAKWDFTKQEWTPPA